MSNQQKVRADNVENSDVKEWPVFIQQRFYNNRQQLIEYVLSGYQGPSGSPGSGTSKEEHDRIAAKNKIIQKELQYRYRVDAWADSLV